jgi:hypothetical protein
LLEAAIERASLSLEGLSAAHQARGMLATLELISPIVENLRDWSEEAQRLLDRTPHLAGARLAELLRTSAAAISNRLHEAFHAEVQAVLIDVGTRAELVDVAAPRLKVVLEALDTFGARAESIHPTFGTLLDGVARGALAPLSKRALAGLAQAPRDELIPTFDAIWEALTAAHVARHLPLDEVLASALSAAVEQDRPRIEDARRRPEVAWGLESYHELRKAMPRTPLSYVAIELCLRVDSAAILEFARAPRLEPFAERVARLPSELRVALCQLDIARLAVSLELFEGWLTQALAAHAAASELFLLLGVLEQEEVAARIRLETEVITAVLPEAAAGAAKLRVRVEELLVAVRGAVLARSNQV